MKIKAKDGSKVSAAEQFGYFCGDFGGSMVNLYISVFYLVFCTYVLGMSTKFMAGLFLVARIWDAVNDPMIGSLPDRFTLGKSGDKFKPWVKVFIIPLAVSGLLCFANVSGFPDLFKHIWVSAVYIFYGMAYTGTSMPYGAMASVITDDPIERTKLSRARAFGGMGVGLLYIPIVNLVIWDKQGNPNSSGYFLMAIVSGLASIVFYSLMLKLSKERIHQDKKYAKDAKTSYSFFRVVKEVFTNRAMVGLMVATIGALFGASQSMSSYVYKEFYHDPRAMAWGAIIGLPAMLLSFFLVPKLAKKLGSRKLIFFASIYTIVLYTVLYVVVIPNVYAFMMINSLAGLGLTSFTMVTWSLATEAIDYQEYKTGDRSDGTMYSMYQFSRKIGTAVVSSLTTALIGVAGYVSGAATQAPGFGDSIRRYMMALPVIGAVVMLIGIGLIFPLNKNSNFPLGPTLEKR